MYHWGLVDSGHLHEVNNDGILSSRPDTLLANGGAFLPSPASAAAYMLPPHAGQQACLSPASSGMAAATSPFRRATSTGDLLVRDMEEDQRVVAAPALAPGRYSAEERRERIDKYRSKRNQRNFQKITYACRKTLADSRPRVKGRFARNAGDCTEADGDDHHHVQQQAAAAATLPPPRSESESSEWWPAAQQEDDAAGIDLDDDMLAAYLGVSSISLYSPSAGAASAPTTTLPHHQHHYS